MSTSHTLLGLPDIKSDQKHKQQDQVKSTSQSIQSTNITTVPNHHNLLLEHKSCLLIKPEDLKQYTVTDEMLKHDMGVGVVTIYQLKNNVPYFVMGEYHNKGALSPTVGAKLEKDKSIYDVISGAFSRKRLETMCFDSKGEINEEIYHSVNTTQNFARLTFVQIIQSNLSEDEFRKKYIDSMHEEAQRQSSVSSFFWKLDETIKGSNFKFKSNKERSQAAEKALNEMKESSFPVSLMILNKLDHLKNEANNYDEKITPLKFYENNGGRKYSELTGFYLMSFADIEKQLKSIKITGSKDKPTARIDHPSLPVSTWKKYFIFEDEIKTILKIIQDLVGINNLTMFRQASDILSPWTVEKMKLSSLKPIQQSTNQLATVPGTLLKL